MPGYGAPAAYRLPTYGGAGIGRGAGYSHIPAAPPSEISVDTSVFVSQPGGRFEVGPGPGAPAVGRGLAVALGRGQQALQNAPGRGGIGN